MRTPKTTAERRGGFSIIELLIVITMLALMMSVLGVVSFTGRNAYEQTALLNDLDSRGARALARVSDELVTAVNLGPISASAGTGDLTFQQVLGFAGGAPVWGPLMRLEAEFEAGEVDDGVDNDGDGLVDERMLVLTRDISTSPKRVVLVRGITEFGLGEIPNNLVDDNGNGVEDEQGFNLQLVGDVITIRMWLQGMNADNQVVVRELQDTVRLRN